MSSDARQIGKAGRLARSGLIAFALLSVGFALGKEMARARHGEPREAGLVEPSPPPDGNGAVVYSLHTDKRCRTCEAIESLTERVVAGRFARPLQAGRLAYRAINYQRRPSVGRLFDLDSGTVVVARYRQGRLIDHRALDDVWVLWTRPERFEAYLAEAIANALRRPPRGKPSPPSRTGRSEAR
jgi:hypothetical protein